MSQPQWASFTADMLVGLGITHLLTCCAAVVRSRDESRPHWIPLVWAAALVLMELHLQPVHRLDVCPCRAGRTAARRVLQRVLAACAVRRPASGDPCLFHLYPLRDGMRCQVR